MLQPEEGTPVDDMLFGNKLENETYEPWKEHYLHYNQLKKSLKEGVILQGTWSDKDEQNFVTLLDSELEKVYSFQLDKYDELSEVLDKLQAQTETASQKFEVDKFSQQLEETLKLAQELDHFQRLNYTGFTKIVKKHDRVHPEYSVRPLLNVRLNRLPFHSEDYSPLLYKVSALFQFLRDNYEVNENLSKLSSFNEDLQQDFKLFKFWIHPDNLMEVKTTILRHLPVLVYDNKQAVDDLLFDDEDEEDTNDPIINCLYFDSPTFDLYNNKLTKSQNSSSMRFKWIGRLLDKPKISVEKKTFDPTAEDYNVTEKVTLKEKYLDSFISGKFSTDKLIKKMIKNGDEGKKIEDFTDTISKLTSFIKDNSLQPCVRTVYKRTAFQIPGDDKVRVVIDSDLIFIREDSFDEQRPIRDPSKWHRTDIDSNVSKPMSLLRKGEFSKFPYSVMEVKVKVSNRKASWLEELVNSHLVKEVPNFSKFVQGVSALFLEDDKLANLPLWLNDLESGITIDPKQAYIDSRKKLLKQQNDEENLNKFKSMLANSSSNSFTPRSKSFSGSLIFNGAEPAPATATATEHDSLIKSSSEFSRTQNQDGPGNNFGLVNEARTDDADLGMSSDDLDDDDDDDEDEGPRLKSKISKISSVLRLSKLIDADSEEEEIDLPEGVSKPNTYIKNAGPLKIEPKVWLANERTFNRWLHVTTLLSTLTFIIYSSANSANSFQLSEILAYIYFALTLFSGVWGYYVFNKRREVIMERSSRHLDNVIGPLIVAFGLIFALVVNFVLGFRRVAASTAISSAPDLIHPGVSDSFYSKNPMHRSIHEFVFKLVGA